MAWLTEERKSLLIGVFASVFTGAVAVCLALWLVAAIAVGSICLVRWLGGL